MAIPTSFINYTPAAGTSKTSPLVGHDTSATGVHLIDVAGTKAPVSIPLDNGMSILMTATFTSDQIVAALGRYLQSLGVSGTGGAGGYKPQGSKAITPTHSTCT